MSEWWVGRHGANPVGPVTTDTLIRGILEKKVPEDALVCRVGEQQWQHIAQVEELWEQVHPEQFHTSVTKQPWFADKAEEEATLPRLDESDGDDDSTRIYSVPILPIRKLGSSPSHPVPTATGVSPSTPTVPLAAANTAAEYSAPEAQPIRASSALPSTSHAPSPKAVIAPPRFGLDRVAPTNRQPLIPTQPVTTATRPEPAATKAPVALGPPLPSAPQAVAAMPARAAVAASPPVALLHAPTAGASRGQSAVQSPPVDNRADDQGSVPLIQSRPNVPSGPLPKSAALLPVRPAIPVAQPLLAPSHAPAMQPMLQHVAPPIQDAGFSSTAVEAEEDAVTVIAKPSAAVPVSPPAIPLSTSPVAPLPLVPEVEPAELFDEDFEPPPPTPSSTFSSQVHSAERDAVIPRPAAGTPAPPSVIITHRPPSMHDDALAHAVSPTPEETRPAIRSIRPPGTIQIGIGTLIIGALALVVLVLLVVLLLR